jgi:hypothetical protein
MSVYFVEPNQLMQELALTELVDICEPVINQLVERFDLAGKTLMSVGAGGAHEEAAFLRSGMRRAFLFDIDEYSTVEPVLRRISQQSQTSARFVYSVDDFLKIQPSESYLEPIDVLYFSSFTPDELRRGEISEQYRGQPQAKLPEADPHWPAGVDPLHEIVLKAIDRHLTSGGIFILQSYCAGVDVLSNPSYVRQWQQVLQRHKVALVEIYYFRAAPAVTLWVGVKQHGRACAEHALRSGMADLLKRPPLTRFHARAQLQDCSIAQLIVNGSERHVA